jgi:hypothetical protein
VEDGLCRTDDEHEVRLDEGRMDTSVVRDWYEPIFLRIVHEDASAERSRPRWGEKTLEVPLAQAAPEAPRDEDRLALVGDAAALEFVDRRRDRLLPGVVRCAGKWERRRLDDDRGLPSACADFIERRPREREPQRVPDGGTHVYDLLGWRRGSQDDVLVAGRDEDDARAREERNATHAG